jgi:L-ascorbate metabolism protein UlaG (beta-lactamase superfamily)
LDRKTEGGFDMAEARRRGLRAGIAGLLGAGLAGGLAWTAREVLPAMGARPSGARAERVRRSPQYADGAFRNAKAGTSTMPPAGNMLREFLFGKEQRRPVGVVPLATPDSSPPGPEDLRVTWYGHSSALVEVDGARVLLDPVWGERVSPSTVAGPRRLHPNPVAIEELPELDAIVISHDHYDHLDLPAVRALLATQTAPFVVPLGVGAHLERWRVPGERIIELDWSEHVELAGLRLTATAAQHFSGRGFRRDGTLWASWVITGPTRKVFYSGDSGYFSGYAEIGAAYGPFDVALVQIGAYNAGWADIHMTPEEGVATALDVNASLLIPVHWATFNLAMHGWTEPVDRVWRECKARGVTLAVPRPGQTVDVADPPAVDGWWQALAG